MICLGNLARRTATALFAAACLSSTTTSAFADTYDVYTANQANSGDTYIVGINGSGQALSDHIGFGYTLYDHGVGTPVGDNIPASFTPDNGSSCSVNYGGASYQGVCNNGYEAFHVVAVPNSDSVYVSHDGGPFTKIGEADLSDPYHGIDKQIFLNSSGDLAFNDESEGPSIQAYNVTPEPSSYILLLTGVGLAFVGHRRLLS